MPLRRQSLYFAEKSRTVTRPTQSVEELVSLTDWQRTKKAVKTTKSSPSAYKGTVGLDLGSKSKSLQSKVFLSVLGIIPVEGLWLREKE